MLPGFDIVEQIINNQRLTNMYEGQAIDVQRLVTLWEIIVEENDSQISFVTEEEKKEWIDFRDKINNKLKAAENPTQVALTLSPISRMVDAPPRESTYKNYKGIKRNNSIHVRAVKDK